MQEKQKFEQERLDSILVDMGYDLSTGVAKRRREPLNLVKNNNMEWMINKIVCDRSEKEIEETIKLRKILLSIDIIGKIKC
jgi:hypothetical protein